MADTDTLDSAVQDDEDLKKKPPQPIGRPIMGPQQPSGGVPIGGGETSSIGMPIAAQPTPPPQPTSPGSAVTMSVTPAAPPEMPAQAPPAMPTGSIGTPINVPAPMTPKPQYHGLSRVLDTIAGSTKIGSAIEGAGGLGTVGWRQKNADEQGQIEQGQEQRQANAQSELTGATAQATEQKPELAEQLGAMRQHLQDEKDQAAFDRTIEIIKGQNARNTDTIGGKENVADTNVQGRENVADIDAQSREDAAKINAKSRVATAGQPRPQIMYVPDPDNPGQYRAITVSSGSEVPAGAQTATGVNTMSTPTAQTRTRGEMAEVTKADEADTFKQIDAIANKIGPAAGRWQQWWVNKVGANDPEFAALDSKLGAYASGLAITHFGARGGGQQYLQQMRKELGEAQSPEDLKARMQAWDGKMAQYARAAGIPQGGATKAQLPEGAIPGTKGGKHGYMLNGVFHAD